MDPKVRSAARLAARQHGVVTVAQLLEAGFTRETVKSWHRRGLLHRELRGVYRLGHRAPSLHARYMAAVLAAGARAALSGLAAAYLYGLIKGGPPAPEISAPGDRRIAGIRTRRRTVPSRIWQGIPTATIPQTITDLAACLSLDDLSRACHEADVRFGVRRLDIARVEGAAKLRAIYEGDHALLLSRMERLFRRLLATEALPLPQTNRPQGAHFVDCRWAARALTVELDSYRFHHTRQAWEADRGRERAARKRGDEFRRYTWRDVVEDPQPMLTDLRALLEI